MPRPIMNRNDQKATICGGRKSYCEASPYLAVKFASELSSSTMRSWTSATPSEVAVKELCDMKDATPGTLMNWVGCVPSSPRGQEPNWAIVKAAPSVSTQMPSAAAIFMGWTSTISWPWMWPEAAVPRRRSGRQSGRSGR